MEVEVINKDKNLIEFYLKGERHSFPSLLKHYLLKDSNVVFASYDLEHPIVGSPKFVLRTDKENPEKALVKAVAAIEKDLKEIKKMVKK